MASFQITKKLLCYLCLRLSLSFNSTVCWTLCVNVRKCEKSYANEWLQVLQSRSRILSSFRTKRVYCYHQRCDQRYFVSVRGASKNLPPLLDNRENVLSPPDPRASSIHFNLQKETNSLSPVFLSSQSPSPSHSILLYPPIPPPSSL